MNNYTKTEIYNIKKMRFLFIVSFFLKLIPGFALAYIPEEFFDDNFHTLPNNIALINTVYFLLSTFNTYVLWKLSRLLHVNFILQILIILGLLIPYNFYIAIYLLFRTHKILRTYRENALGTSRSGNCSENLK
jgi:hypothetical protein